VAASASSPFRTADTPPRYNGAPGQEQFVIRQNPKTGERTLDRLWISTSVKAEER
jgi:hypothetical protein